MKPFVLIVLDGWGLAPPGPGNAISLAKLETIPFLWQSYPHTELSASGEAVGLPYGEDGNTETGHINIGAGRTVFQDLPRISMAIKDDSFFKNDAFLAAVAHARTNKSNIHILGVVSDAGVHASREHLYAILELIKKQGIIHNVYIHVFADGRDAPPISSERFVGELQSRLSDIGIGKIASVIGRYYAMDRDRRWERTEKAYRCLTESEGGLIAKSASEAIRSSYGRHVTDEFIEPTIIVDTATGRSLPRIQDNDAVIFFNFRIDRPRQLTRALVVPDFETAKPVAAFDPYAVKYFHRPMVAAPQRDNPFTRKVVLKNLFFVTMTQYEPNIPVSVAFPPQKVFAPLGSVLSEYKIRQLRVSETEKERFVTYYFNGQREDPFPGEDRIIVPSPAVPTYDMKPEMSTPELEQTVIAAIDGKSYAFIVVNVACPDMVAHTGDLPATIKACEAADSLIGAVVGKTLSQKGAVLVIGDHGNAEELVDPVTGGQDTEHSSFPVPFILVMTPYYDHKMQLPPAILADVAPTILKLLDLERPQAMTGRALI